MTGPAPATTRNKGQRHRWRAVGVGAAATLLLAACGSTAPKPSASGTSPAKATSSVDLRGVTITLEGPNQWNDSGSSFGKPWTNLIASFKKATGITVKTVVLPLASFASTETTQLAAGTAPQLVFDQATYKPYMITDLSPYLDEPNPFVKNNKKWLSVFRSEYYGPTNPQSLDANGNFFMIPFNLVAVGVYYNENAFAKAHVKAPIATFQDLLTACHQLKAAGYTPFAMNNSTIGVSWTEESIFNQLAAGEGLYEKLDDYAAKGAKGTNPVLVQEDFDRALALGTLNASRYPAEAETLKLMKELYDSCATPNWSGITGLSGSVVGLSQFAPGRAAMAWGVDFGFGALGGVHFKVSSMPFPTVTTATTSLSHNFPAEFGNSTGGTSYMIPSTTKGKKLEAAIRFLQYVSSPNIQPWLDATGGVPATTDATAPVATRGFGTGAWAKSPVVGAGPSLPPSVSTSAAYDNYLLGDKSLGSEEAYLQSLWLQGAAYNIKNDGWPSRPWMSRIPAS